MDIERSKERERRPHTASGSRPSLGSGLYEFGKAYKGDVLKKFAIVEMGPEVQDYTRKLGRAGHGARGVVFGIAGAFVIVAAVQHNPQQARGLDGTLETLMSQPYGPWLMGVVAVGLACYGLYTMVKARYRRVAGDPYEEDTGVPA